MQCKVSCLLLLDIFGKYYTFVISNDTIMIKHIPNTITCLNLLSGCVAVIFALSGRFEVVVLCVVLSALFDFCDGLAARLLKAYSPMGKELDSLADLVSFGLAPALMIYHLLHTALPQEYNVLAYIALLIPVFAALRLAKFNIDDSQATTFKGLAVPANALWWLGAYDLYVSGPQSEVGLILLVASIPLFAYMMVCNLPMFSLKFAGLGWHGNEVRYLLIAASVVLLIWQGIAGFAAIIGLYILLSLLAYNRNKIVTK